MRILIFLIFAIVIPFGQSCNNAKVLDNAPRQDVPRHTSPGAELLAQAVNAHGGNKYRTAYYQFQFRGKTYTFENDNDLFEYTVSSIKDGATINDVYNNDGITRSVDGSPIGLTPKQIDNYTEAINSVVYFATIPYKLQDPAVILAQVKDTKIKGQAYSILKVNFREEGGGKDFDDNFIYWINKATSRIDYLAYDYQVNNGGVRFRSAYNPRVIDGILFQDYVNYKAPVGTALLSLPALYEQDQLKKLSLIETEEVINLR